MQYLVSEIIGRASRQESKVFDSIATALKYLERIDKNQRLLIGKEEVSVEVLSKLLGEKLSTVSVIGSLHPEVKYIISAF